MTTTLLTLPDELIELIIQQSSRVAQKALRLAHPRFSMAVGHIFRRAIMSKFQRDFDNFSNISTTPHLAGLVKEVAWYELVHDYN